jgi:hypothetical protein
MILETPVATIYYQPPVTGITPKVIVEAFRIKGPP